MKTTQKYDVIIVGARAAGASTAMLLARQGLRVLAVDRARYGSDTLSTHAMMRTAVVQLNRWGLLDRVRDSGATPISDVVFRYPDETVGVKISPSSGVDTLYAPRRTVLDSILVDAAREAGAEVWFGMIVDDVRKDRTGRVIGLSARDEYGESLDLDADVVVGADGIRSIVAQTVNAPVILRAKNSGAVVYGYYAGIDAKGYEWAYAPGVAAGLIPTNDGQTCVFVAGSETAFRRDVFPNLEEGFASTLRTAFPELGDRVARASEAGRHRGFAGVRGYIRQCSGPGWALVGDAGYFRDPITTHGISDAFRDAELLARTIAESSPLSEYQHLRDGVIGDLFDVTDQIAGYDWSMEELKQHMRDVSRAMRPELRLIGELDSAEAA